MQEMLSDIKISLPTTCFRALRIIYFGIMGTSNTNSKGDTMRTYTIGIALALVIGTFVAIELVQVLSSVAAKLDSVMVL